MKHEAFQTERTDQGEQILVPGVRPIRPRDRLQALADAPLRSRRAQRPCNIGLFDEDARKQLDLFLHTATAELRQKGSRS